MRKKTDEKRGACGSDMNHIETQWLDVQRKSDQMATTHYTSDKCYRKIIIFKYYTAFAYRDPYGAIYKAVLFLLKPKHSFWLAPAPPFFNTIFTQIC